MDMSSSSTSSSACQISMLFNKYTINACFLTSKWHIKSKGMFAGSCIGVFFWVILYLWWHRVCCEYDQALTKYKADKFRQSNVSSCCCCEDGKEAASSSPDESSQASPVVQSNSYSSSDSSFIKPIVNTFAHNWFGGKSGYQPDGSVAIYPSAFEHLFKAVLYTIEWGCSYLIMLMWMYYNVYMIATMVLGYFFGQLIFNYTPVASFSLPREKTCGVQEQVPSKEEQVPANEQQVPANEQEFS